MAKAWKGVSFAKNRQGRDCLAPIRGKYKSRFIIHPDYKGQKDCIEPKKRKNDWWNKLDPWKVAINGYKDVKIFRNCADILKYDIKRIINLLYKTNVIKSTRPCPRKQCNGTLHIHHNPSIGAKTEWGRHGGYLYLCDGGDGPNGCKGKQKWRSILTGMVLYNRIDPEKLLKLLFAYSVVSHTVKNDCICTFTLF